MAVEFKNAWNKKTGKKLEHKVPETHFRIFPDTLSPTPVQKEQDRQRAARPTETPVAPAQVKIPKTEGDK